MYRIIVAILIVVASLTAYADPLDVYEMATENNVFAGVRAAGMAGTQIAAADDGAALWYNPALLTRIRKLEFSGALSHQSFSNRTIFDGVLSDSYDVTSTRLSSLWAVMPVPTQRGGLTLAFSANRVRDFDRTFRFESSPGWLKYQNGDGFGGGEDDRGGLWAYSLGGGLELSPKTSIGFALDLYDGKDQYSYFDDEIVDSDYSGITGGFEDNYSGYSAKLGLGHAAGRDLFLGAVIRFPTLMEIEQIDNYSLIGNYEYRLPFSMGAGALYTIRNLLLTADINYTDYKQLEYESGLDDVSQALEDVNLYYTDVLGYSTGAEYMFPRKGLTLRAGYAHDPIPFTYFDMVDDLDVFTAGFGYLLDRSLKIDMAINFLNWIRRDLYFNTTGTEEEYNATRFFVGLTYRL